MWTYKVWTRQPYTVTDIPPAKMLKSNRQEKGLWEIIRDFKGDKKRRESDRNPSCRED